MEYMFIVSALIAVTVSLAVVIRRLSDIRTDFTAIRMELEALLKSNREMGEALERLRSARNDAVSPVCHGKPHEEVISAEETAAAECMNGGEKSIVRDMASERLPADVRPETAKSADLTYEEASGSVTVTETTPAREARVASRINYERFIGENLLGKVGILVLVIGVGLFIKYYALEQEWFGRTLRTVLSFVLGVGLLGLSFRLRNSYRAFSSVLAGGAFAVFYVTVAVAFHYYDIFSQTTAFIMLVAFTAGMAVLSHLYDRRELAVIALLGGLSSPFLISTGTGSYGVLFTYLTVLDLGMLALVLRKRWGELTVICFAGTWLSMLIYRMNAGGAEWHDPRPVFLALFAAVFHLIFILSVFFFMRSARSSRMSQVSATVSVVNDFVFAAFGIFFVGEAARSYAVSDNLQGLCTLWVALVNGAVCSMLPPKGEAGALKRLSMTMAVLFAALSVPASMDGHLITVFWAAETAVLSWLCMRTGNRITGIGATVLAPVATATYIFDAAGASFASRYGETAFLSPLFAEGAVLAVSVFLFSRFMRSGVCFGTNRKRICNAALAVSIILCLQVFVLEFMTMIAAPVIRLMLVPIAFAITAAAVELCYRRSLSAGNTVLILPFAVITSLAWVSALREYPPTGYPAGDMLQWVAVAAAAAVLWLTVRIGRNRQTVFTVAMSLMFTAVTVISALVLMRQLSIRDESGAAFSVALVVSGFALMRLGMSRHIKAVRMVGLALFAIVIYKLFANDIWLMATLGKVLTFILSGAALLALSFLYQKLKSALSDGHGPDNPTPEKSDNPTHDNKNGK